jgi:predicted adenylyl cyclase CyaB
VRVVKKRKKTHYKDYEICLDEIENLGTFIEIEKIGNEKDADKIQKDMLDFLDKLRVSKNDIVKKGYDILMLEKQYS